jgi:hypothetical protein
MAPGKPEYNILCLSMLKQRVPRISNVFRIIRVDKKRSEVGYFLLWGRPGMK